MTGMTFLALVTTCAPLVHSATASALVSVESGFNPHAIGVVGGMLERQPRSHQEAMATIRSLQANGWNYSVGLAQINARNFARLGLDTASALDPCRNLAAMQVVLLECLRRHRARVQQVALRRALSCYYSGNAITGFRHGYVQRVVAASQRQPIAALTPPTEKE
jgi:type IV secretion system protein VirB1